LNIRKIDVRVAFRQREGRRGIPTAFGKAFLNSRSSPLLFLPPYAPELNPKENLWDEIREKIFKNYALKSIDAVRAKLKEAILYMERKPEIVKSITSFPYILKSL
jgi:transposase